MDEDVLLLKRAINFFGSQGALAEAMGICRRSVTRYHKQDRPLTVCTRWAIKVLVEDSKAKKYSEGTEARQIQTLDEWVDYFIAKRAYKEADRFIEELTEGRDVDTKTCAPFCFSLAFSISWYEKHGSLKQLIKELEEEECGHL